MFPEEIFLFNSAADLVIIGRVTTADIKGSQKFLKIV
jgi:hypothetical protein